MRITNKIMQNNSLYNINNNKITENQLNTMMSTGKKITRPSDDPVIAIRALRLRSSVTQISQYYEKNAKDAESWLDVTADALSTVTAVLTDCVKQATKGANMDLTLDDLSTIVTQMGALSKEYYSTGNVDFAGR
ncbi:MAG: flagellar hook-associated protein 3, partial [Butyrivibrio sp.]|nr:flagellar hook-associated protein 3 [Butyrivibrio sp.]